MSKKFLGILVALLLVMWVTPLMREYSNQLSPLEDAPALVVQGLGDDPNDPFPIAVDTYYGDDWDDYWDSHDVRYLTFDVIAEEIYFIYHDPALWWDLELYADSNYSVFLGSPYAVSLGKIFHEYLTFSPNRTDAYYVKLIQTATFGGTFAVLTADSYLINTSEMVIIGGATSPIRVFQIDLEAGNYSSTQAALYATVDRGSDYGVFEEAYGKFPTGQTFSLEAGSYGILFEDSCQFQLTYFNETPHEDPPDDPPSDNSTDTGDPGSPLDEITPIFGIGVLLGILVVYKVKKK